MALGAEATHETRGMYDHRLLRSRRKAGGALMSIPFDVTDRMLEAARLKNHSALAADLGVTPQALSNYKRRGDFPAGLVIDFAAKHGLSIDWLVTGKKPG